MIITETFYGLKCDRCGEIFEDGEHSFWTDENSVIENAFDSEWQEVAGKYYCTGCSEVTDDDEVIIYPDYPKHLKTLNGFIDRIVKGMGRTVIESEDGFFTVKFRFYNNIKLETYEAEYIKNLLGDYFVSIDYLEEKYKTYYCLIKFKE